MEHSDKIIASVKAKSDTNPDFSPVKSKILKVDVNHSDCKFRMNSSFREANVLDEIEYCNMGNVTGNTASDDKLSMEVGDINEDFDIDDILQDKEKVIKRRSSYGKNLLKCQYAPVDNENAAGKFEVEEKSSNILISGSSLNLEKTEESNSEQTLSRFKFYLKKTEQLSDEYKAWKNLLKTRINERQVAWREHKEAKCGQILAKEETFIPLLNPGQKSFLLARPDCSQYIQQIRYSNEKLKLFFEEIQRTEITFKRFLEFCQIKSKFFCKLEEEKFLGDLKDVSVKGILESMKGLNCTDVPDDVLNPVKFDPLPPTAFRSITSAVSSLG